MVENCLIDANKSYRPSSGFDVLYVRRFLPNSKCTALIYRTGKVGLVGGRSLSELDMYADMLVTAIGSTFKRTEIIIYNIVGSYDCLHRIFLESLYNFVISSKNTADDGRILSFLKILFDPEFFPAVKIRPYHDLDDNTTCLIFRSGKLIVTGSSSMHTLNSAANIVYNLCKKFFI